MAKDTVKMSLVRMDLDLYASLEEYRVQNGFPSLASTIKHILRTALNG